MNMTVQLARAAMFPTNSMFKQMLKFEKHMDGLILAEGIHGVYGSRGIEILCGHNDHLLRRYRRFKRHSEIKRADKEIKIARKTAKQMAALREVRAKSRSQKNVPAYSFDDPALIPGEGPIPERATKVYYNAVKSVQAPTPEQAPVAQDVVVNELSEVKKYCEILKAQMEEAEKRREEDDVANKLNEVVEKLISTAKDSGKSQKEDEEEEDDDDDDDEEEEENVEDDENLEDDEDDRTEDQSSIRCRQSESENINFPDFQSCNITEDQKQAIMRILLGKSEEEKVEAMEVTQEQKIEESSDDEEEIEKIDDKDVDAMEYEML